MWMMFTKMEHDERFNSEILVNMDHVVTIKPHYEGSCPFQGALRVDVTDPVEKV